jgi:hypothetical protein
MTSAEEHKAQRRANRKLEEIGKVYHNGLALAEIDAILTAEGFRAMEEAIYCGREGGVHEQVGDRTWLRMSWHKKEETGRFEVLAYLS